MPLTTQGLNKHVACNLNWISATFSRRSGFLADGYRIGFNVFLFVGDKACPCMLLTCIDSLSHL